MKILVCGKGGCGKSTISTLIAKEIAKRGNRVLVMDTDESNFGLHAQLGMEPPKDFMNYFGGKEVLFEKAETLKKDWKLSELPEKFTTEKENIKLLSMGKIHDFGEGCACPINALTSKFLENLELNDNEYLVADTDAGIEHLGRGVDEGADFIVTIVEPSQESIRLAQKIARMAKDIGKRVSYILNKVNGEVKKTLSNSLDNNKIIASVPRDERIHTYGLEGKEIDFEVKGIKKSVDYILKS